MIVTLAQDMPRRGSHNNPIELAGPIPTDYPAEFADRPYVYMRPKGGDVPKVYRSYSDYCD